MNDFTSILCAIQASLADAQQSLEKAAQSADAGNWTEASGEIGIIQQATRELPRLCRMCRDVAVRESQ